MRENVILCWSGGKDSALALYEIKKSEKLEVVCLFTAVTEGYLRVSMHGVREDLINKQADSLGIPLEKVFISKKSSNEEYESKMKESLLKYKELGINSVVFGDIFLEDVRKYRQDNLAKIGMKAIFPLWEKDTMVLAHNFINLGFKCIVTCVDSHYLPKVFCGKILDKDFLRQLPQNIDPCGENGEFHSFVFDGPVFRKKIVYSKKEVVLRDNRFYYCDIGSS